MGPVLSRIEHLYSRADRAVLSWSRADKFAIAFAWIAVTVWFGIVVGSVEQFRSAESSSVGVGSVWAAIDELAFTGVVCVLSVGSWILVERALSRRGVVVVPEWLVGVSWWWRFVCGMGLWALGTVGAQFVLALSGSKSMNVPTSADYSQLAEWILASSTVLAGLKEEPFFAALAVLGLGVLRVPIVGVVVISASARAFMHLYQGVGPAVAAFVWGGVAVCAYYLFRNIWGLVVGHMLYNAGVLALVADVLWLGVGACSILVGVAIVSMVGQVGARGTSVAKEVSGPAAELRAGSGERQSG